MRPAAAVKCQSLGSQLRLMKPEEQQAPGHKEQEDRSPAANAEDPEGSAVVPRVPLAIVADAELHSLVTSCCVETLWLLPRAIADLQQALAPVRRSPAGAPRLMAADRWKSAARSATLNSAASAEPAPQAPAEAAAAEAGASAGGTQRAGSARMPGLNIDPGLVTGPSSDPGDAASAATSPEDQTLDAHLRERMAGGSQASTPVSSTAAQAAREAWASSFRSAASIEPPSDRLGRRHSLSSRSAGACPPLPILQLCQAALKAPS